MSAPFSVTLGPRPVWESSPVAPPGVTGKRYGVQLAARDAAAFAVVRGALPPGLSLTPGGELAGTPVEAGLFAATVRAAARDGWPHSDRTFSLLVSSVPRWVTAAKLPVAEAGAELLRRLRADGAQRFELALGELPDGADLSSNGLLSGAPEQPGLTVFAVRAVSALGSSERTFSLELRAPPRWDPEDAAADALERLAPGVHASVPLDPEAQTEYTVVGPGALPEGLRLSTAGLVTGTPVREAAAFVTLRVRNGAGGPSRNRALTVTCALPPDWLTPARLPRCVAGEALRVQLRAQGARRYALAGPVPPGLALSPAGVLVGAPTSPGLAGFEVDAADDSDSAGARSARRAFQLPVAPAAPALEGPAELRLGAELLHSALASAGADAFSAEGLPPGVTLSPADGRLTGAPTAAGAFVVTAHAAGGGERSAAATLTLVVAAAPAWGPGARLAAAPAGAHVGRTLAAANALGYELAAPAGGLRLTPLGYLHGVPDAAGAGSVAVAVRALGALSGLSTRHDFELPVFDGWSMSGAAAGLAYDPQTDALTLQRDGRQHRLPGPAAAAPHLQAAHPEGLRVAAAPGAPGALPFDGLQAVELSGGPPGLGLGRRWRATLLAAGLVHDAGTDSLSAAGGGLRLVPPGRAAALLGRAGLLAGPAGPPPPHAYGASVGEHRERGGPGRDVPVHLGPRGELVWRCALPAASVPALQGWRADALSGGAVYDASTGELSLRWGGASWPLPPPSVVSEALRRVSAPRPSRGPGAALSWDAGDLGALAPADAFQPAPWTARTLAAGAAFDEASGALTVAGRPVLPPSLAAAALLLASAPGASLGVARAGEAFHFTALAAGGGASRASVVRHGGRVALRWDSGAVAFWAAPP